MKRKPVEKNNRIFKKIYFLLSLLNFSEAAPGNWQAAGWEPGQVSLVNTSSEQIHHTTKSSSHRESFSGRFSLSVDFKIFWITGESNHQPQKFRAVVYQPEPSDRSDELSLSEIFTLSSGHQPSKLNPHFLNWSDSRISPTTSNLGGFFKKTYCFKLFSPADWKPQERKLFRFRKCITRKRTLLLLPQDFLQKDIKREKAEDFSLADICSVLCFLISPSVVLKRCHIHDGSDETMNPNRKSFSPSLPIKNTARCFCIYDFTD